MSSRLNSIPLLIAFYLARRIPTRRYTYGFGRAEDVAGILIVLSIAVSAVIVFSQAIQRLLNPQPMESLGWVAAAAMLPDADLQLVDGDAHMPWQGEAEPITRAVLDFLTGLGGDASEAGRAAAQGDSHVWRREGDLWRLRFDGEVPLLALTAMEIVLGIDNIIFISIVTSRLPKEQQAKGRFLGLSLAMILLAIGCIALSFAVLGGLREPWLINAAQETLTAGPF